MPLETVVVNDENLFDVAIIGGGPGGLNAAAILASAKYKVCFIEQSVPGGKVSSIDVVHNYPPKPNSKGVQLAQEFFEKATKSGAKYISNKVVGLEKKLKYICINGENGMNWYCHCCIIATGTENKHLNIQGEKDYFQLGVSYCINCDSVLSHNKKVCVIGENDEAMEGALKLLKIAKDVCLFSELEKPKSKNYTFDKLKQEGVKVFNLAKVLEISGNSYNVEHLVYKQNNIMKRIDVDFVFIEKGHIPANSFITNKKMIDKNGCIITDKNKLTKMANVYAIGDITRNENKSIINAIKDSEIACKEIIKQLKKIKR